MYKEEMDIKLEAIKKQKSVKILAIESSCDETSVAIVRDGKEVISNVVFTQIDIHKAFGGVVPEVASRSHVEKITYVFNKITNSSKKLAIITDEQWEVEKNNYIKSIKEGNSYKVLDEPVEIYEESKKSDIITNSAIELFGDIVEIN